MYDAIGNPTTYRGKTATWTRGRKLTAYDGNTFSYDATGRRLRKNSIKFYYDSEGTLLKQSNGLEFFYGADGLVAIKYGGLPYLCRKDMLGNILALLDSSGNVVVQYKYDAWGNHTVTDANGNAITDANHIGNLNPFRYRGYYFDCETGFYFLQTRYYDPEVGRFLNMDSVEYADPESVNGINLYSYCINDPVNYYDPSGHFIISLIIGLAITGAAIGGAVSGVSAYNNGARGWDVVGAVAAGAVVGGAIGAAAGAMAAGGVALISGGASMISSGLAAGGGMLALAGGGTAAGAGAAAVVAGAGAIAVGGTLVLGGAVVGIAGLNVLLAQWEPGSWPGDDSTVSPGDGFEWRGQQPVGGDKGAWYNPKTKESLHPDLNHPEGIAPHWDWTTRNKIVWRIFRYFIQRR